MDAKTISIKFPTSCHTCGGKMNKGAEALWLKDEAGKGHVYCSSLCLDTFNNKDEENEEGGYTEPEYHNDESNNHEGQHEGGGNGEGQGQGQNKGQNGEGQKGEKQPMLDHEKPDWDGGYKKRQEFITDALDKGHSTGDIYHNVKDRIGKDERWTIRQNTGNGERGEAYDIKTQQSKMSYYINRLAAEHAKKGGSQKGQGSNTDPEGGEMGRMQSGGGSGGQEHPIDYFYRRTLEIRDFCDKGAGVADSTRLDQISLRPIVNGVAAIKAGINPDALLHAMICHWPDEDKKKVNVKPVPLSKMGGKKIPGEHEAMGYVLALAEARVPIMLKGPAGTGKSFLARALARVMFGDDEQYYGEAPLTAGAMPSWLIGANTVDGFKSRPFLEIYSGGGVFNFEELDAADANMLMVLNNALAQDRFYNPANGQVYEKHPDFIPVSTANTWGQGANRFYNAREKLDFATRDRWRMGRVEIHLDTNVERSLVEAAKESMLG